jgi:Tfp pilus assembly protein PilE
MDWATLLSALGGAVVGALASIAGSYMQAGQADKARRATAEEAAQTIQATAEEDEKTRKATAEEDEKARKATAEEDEKARKATAEEAEKARKAAAEEAGRSRKAVACQDVITCSTRLRDKVEIVGEALRDSVRATETVADKIATYDWWAKELYGLKDAQVRVWVEGDGEAIGITNHIWELGGEFWEIANDVSDADWWTKWTVKVSELKELQGQLANVAQRELKRPEINVLRP